MAINFPQSLSSGAVVTFRNNGTPWTLVPVSNGQDIAVETQNVGSSFNVNVNDPTMVKFTNGEYVLNTSDIWSTCVIISGSGS